MSETAERACGRLAWEVVETSTGHVSRHQRDLRVGDIEVMVYPPPVRPRFDRFRSAPRQVAGEAVGWVLRGGRGSTRKRLRLADGFWLVLRERLAPERPRLLALTARLEGGRTSCVEWFEADDEGVATHVDDETSTLQLVWAPNPDGLQELVSTTFTTDVTLALRPAQGPLGRPPAWTVRVLAGSVVRWPPSAEGVRLVPRLRPDRAP